MLAELGRLRALQAAQAEALEAGEMGRLHEMHAERLALQARLGRDALERPAPEERRRAEAVLADVARRQEALTARAAAVAGALGADLRRLGAGRSALSGYRPAPGGDSFLLDRTG